MPSPTATMISRPKQQGGTDRDQADEQASGHDAHREGHQRERAAQHRRIAVAPTAFGQHPGHRQGQHDGEQVGHLEVTDEGELPAHRHREQDGDRGADGGVEVVPGGERRDRDRHGERGP